MQFVKTNVALPPALTTLFPKTINDLTLQSFDSERTDYVISGVSRTD